MMAASASSRKPELSKAEYLKRYLSGGDDTKKSKGKLKKKRLKPPGKGLKIVDDDVDWRQTVRDEEEVEEDEEEAPVIAEVIDDRPDAVKQLEAFRTGNRWKVIGADDNVDAEEDGQGSGHQRSESSSRHDSPELSSQKRRHDSPDMKRKTRHDLPDVSPTQNLP